VNQSFLNPAPGASGYFEWQALESLRYQIKCTRVGPGWELLKCSQVDSEVERVVLGCG